MVEELQEQLRRERFMKFVFTEGLLPLKAYVDVAIDFVETIGSEENGFAVRFDSVGMRGFGQFAPRQIVLAVWDPTASDEGMPCTPTAVYLRFLEYVQHGSAHPQLADVAELWVADRGVVMEGQELLPGVLAAREAYLAPKASPQLA